MSKLDLGKLAVLTWVALMILGLSLGFQEPLFFGSGERGGQGIDFFCVPKAFLNLLHGTSAFDTWGGAPYGPYSTWFVLHPAVALWIGGYLSWLPPWWAYAAWVGVTLAALVACGFALGQHASSPQRRLLAIAALLTSPITYLLLLYGNVHGVIVVASTLLLLGLHELASGAPPALRLPPTAKIMAGLLLSLLCKPVLILVGPALLIPRATRAAALASAGAYAAASLLLVLLPPLNPEAVGLDRLGWLTLHPDWVSTELEVYRHRFVLIPEMLDNAMHWFHMIAQSDHVWDHVQIFSLPVMLGSFVSVSTAPFRWVALLPAALSPLLFRLPEPRRPAAVAWLVVLALASHFIGYAIAWEYQYAQLLVVTAALLALPTMQEPNPRWSRLALGGLLLLYLPTPYAWLKDDGLSALDLALMRTFRVVPALLVAAASLGAFIQHVKVARALEAEAPDSESAVPTTSLTLEEVGLRWLAAVRRRPALSGALAAFLLAPPSFIVVRRALDPGDAKAAAAEVGQLVSKSRQLLDSGQTRASLLPLERARRKEPDAFAVQNNLCVAYGILERKKEAVERCRRAVELEPADSLARNNLSWVEGIREP